MRDKQAILNDSLKLESEIPKWDSSASMHERLTIEVLIDIRDILQTFLKDVGQHLFDRYMDT